MNLINRLAARLGFEKRAEPSWPALAQLSGMGSGYTARAAENLSAVLACTTAISTALATLPALVYERDSQGNRREVPNHPVARMVREGPNDSQTWCDWLEHWLSSCLLTGNGLSEVRWGMDGQPESLHWHGWNRAAPVLLSTGRIAYDVTDPQGRTRRLLQDDVMHLRDRTDDGLIGRSRLSRAAGTLEGVTAADDFARNFMGNAARPSGIISLDQVLSEQQLAQLHGSLAEGFTGRTKAGRVLVLPGGMKWQAAQISPEDTELLATRKFGVEEICRLYQVPPPIVQDYSHNTFTNSETAGRWFAMFCLAPWARKIEAEFKRSIFPKGSAFELELDLSGFLRGDPATRWQAHQIALQNNVLDPDEVRQVEGWNARAAA